MSQVLSEHVLLTSLASPETPLPPSLRLRQLATSPQERNASFDSLRGECTPQLCSLPRFYDLKTTPLERLLLGYQDELNLPPIPDVYNNRASVFITT